MLPCAVFLVATCRLKSFSYMRNLSVTCVLYRPATFSHVVTPRASARFNRYPHCVSLVTMRDSTMPYAVPNPIDRHGLGVDDKVKKNADRSFTIYAQHDHQGPEK
jgi:hypothetical protein